MKRKDLTGKRFGRLTVLEYAGTKYNKDGKNARAQWKCKCDCGNIRTVVSANLLLGRTKSCGCLCRDINRELLKKNVHKYLKKRKNYIQRLQDENKKLKEQIDFCEDALYQYIQIYGVERKCSKYLDKYWERKN